MVAKLDSGHIISSIARDLWSFDEVVVDKRLHIKLRTDFSLVVANRYSAHPFVHDARPRLYWVWRDGTADLQLLFLATNEIPLCCASVRSSFDLCSFAAVDCLRGNTNRSEKRDRHKSGFIYSIHSHDEWHSE